MKQAAILILVYPVFGVLGCALHGALGEPIDDPVQRDRLLKNHLRATASKVVFRTLIDWPGREVSVVETVQALDDGGRSVVGVTDIGTTLYAVRVDPTGQGRVFGNKLPFSDAQLLDTLVAELLIPWRAPSAASRLHVLENGQPVLVDEQDHVVRMFVYDDAGQWRGFRRVVDGVLQSRTSLEWDESPVPTVLRSENRQLHYRAVRQRASFERQG